MAWIDGRTRAVDVVYHRTDEDRFSGTALGAALLEPCRDGTLACVNAPGSGLADDKLVHAYVEEMVRFYLDEEPLLASVASHPLDEPGVLDRLDEMVVKPRGEMGGEGVVIWRDADAETRERERARIERDPRGFVAQELVTLSVHPTVCGERLEPRHVDLRPYATVDDAGVHLLPGGLSRVALDRGSMIVNSGQGGGVKDTWVAGLSSGLGAHEAGEDVLRALDVLAHEPDGATGVAAPEQLDDPAVLRVRAHQHLVRMGDARDQVAHLPLHLRHGRHELGEIEPPRPRRCGSARRRAGTPRTGGRRAIRSVHSSSRRRSSSSARSTASIVAPASTATR